MKHNLLIRLFTLLGAVVFSVNVWGETKQLDFNFVTHPSGWKNSKENATAGTFTYTLDDVSYSFTLTKSGDGIYCGGTSGSSGYLFIVSGNTLGLPAISGYKLTKVVGQLNDKGTPSTSSQVAVTTNGSDAVTGGSPQTWSTKGSEYTYTLTGTSDNTSYLLAVTNKNCQMINLKLTYESAGPTKLGTPTGLSSSNITKNSATIEWNKVTNASGYSVSCTGATIGNISVGATKASCQLTSLSKETQYTWKVKAIGDGTNYADGDYSSTANFTTLGPTYTDYITECSSDPSISVSTTELNGFTYIYSQGPSAAKMVTVYGSYLDNDVTVTASDNYEICLSQDGTYTSTINLTPADQMVNAPVYVRLKAGKDANSYNGTLTVASSGLDSKTVSLSGSVSQQQLATPSVTATPAVHQITLSWDPVLNASSYQLVWNGGTPETVTSPVIKTGLTGGQSYSYSLIAVGTGNYSNSAAAEGSATAGKETYTVTWNIGANQETTANVEEGSLFSSLSAPSVADNAAGDCANKFMGWATQAIDGSEGVNEDQVSWVNSSSAISASNNEFYAVFANKDGGDPTSLTLNFAQYTYGIGNSWTSTENTFTTGGISFNYVNSSVSKDVLNIGSEGYLYNTTSFVDIKSIAVTMTNGDFKYKTGNSAISGKQTDGTSVSTTQTLTPLSGGYFNFSGGSNTAKISQMVISYSTATYSNYVTSCTPPVYTAITLDKGTNGQTDGSATAQQGKTDLTDFTHAVGPDHYHLLGYYDNETQVIDANGDLVANVTNYTDEDGKWLKDDESLTLTAQWEVNSHTLTWAGLDGANITTAGSPASGSVAWNTALTAPVATKDGYQLIGWSPEVPATMPDDDATYTALWAPVIVITSQPTDKICYQDDENVSLAIVATIGEGTLSYQWQSSANGTDGWANAAGESATAATYHPSTSSIGVTYYRCVVTSNLGLEEISDVATVTVNQKLSNKYTITYAYQGWSTDAGTQVLEVDGGSTVTLPAGMTKEGYNFVKWEMSDGTQHDPGYEFTMPTENIIILAVLEEIQQPISYTIKGSAAAQLTAWTAQPTQVGYWDNDLTAEYTITDGYYVSTAAVTVNGMALTTSEYTVDNSTLIITPSAGKFAGDVSITLTIEPMQYTVTLSALGATNAYTAQVEATFGQEMPTPITLPVRPGYTFLGYFDAETGGTQYYSSTGASAHAWDIPAGATLIAQWSTDSYGITYTETANLTWGEKPATINIETAMLTANYTVTAGYEVTGMTVTVGGATIDESAIAYDNETVIIETTFSGAVVITPTVTPIHYTITYLKNDGSASSSIQEAVYMQDVTLKDGTAFKRKGYTIDHWATEDETVTYAKGYTFEPYNLTSDLTLKAIWAVKESDWYTITFVDQMQDKEVEPIRGILTIDGFTFPTLEDKETPPDDTGQCNVQHYHFMGWIADADKNGEITESNIIKGGTVFPAASVTANATYYAIWATATIQ